QRMTVVELSGHGTQRALHRLVAVGQLSIDTILALDRALVIGDQNSGARSTSIGGTAAIVAHNAAALGGAPVFAGHVGSSSADQEAVAGLVHAGVPMAATVCTPIGLRVCILIGPDGERTMIAAGPKPNWLSLRIPFRSGDLAFFEGWHLFDPD